MRVVFGVAALAIIAGAYALCPETVRHDVNHAITPGEDRLAEIGEGMKTLMNLFKGPGDIQPDTIPPA